MFELLNSFLRKETFEKQKTYIQNNNPRVREQDYSLLKYSSILFFVSMLVVALACLMFRELRSGVLVYTVSAAIGAVFFIITVFPLKRFELPPLPFVYLLYTMVLWTCCQDAVFLDHGIGSATAFCGMIIVFSMLVIDYTWRINLYIVLMTAAFCVCCFCGESYTFAIRDSVNAFVFCMLAIMIGNISRTSRLCDFESERILQIERNIDTLTKIPNRRRLFEAIIDSESPDCLTPYTGAIMIDIDNFKVFNDSYGHQSGDRVLQQIGCFFGDFGFDFKFEVFRYGGEEFLALTKGYSYDKLGMIADNLVETVRALNIPFKESPSGVVTVSAGYALSDKKHNIKYERLIQAADTALYEAKRTGRNKAVKFQRNQRKTNLR